jgi:rare lipoprotein A (peptidoglycan hydrolase)
MRRRLTYGLALVLSVVSLGAAQRPNSSGSKPLRKVASQATVVPPAAPKKARPKPYQVGTASWYGNDFQGKATATGEPYNMYDLTAAHMKLPLGTKVRVTNVRNGKAVVVRINDRGPVVPGRIIDLSYSAARVLGMKGYGVQKVRLDVMPNQQPQQVATLRPLAY